MELEVYTTNVELQDIPSYTTSITLEGQLLRLSFLWNERIGKRTLSIKNSSDECYLQNTVLHPNEPLELNSNAVLDDLPYSVTLVKVGDVNKVGNIFNWSKDFILCFSRTVDLDVKRLNVVHGVTIPSTPTLPPIVRPPEDGGATSPDDGGDTPPNGGGTSPDEGGQIPEPDDPPQLNEPLILEVFHTPNAKFLIQSAISGEVYIDWGDGNLVNATENISGVPTLDLYITDMSTSPVVKAPDANWTQIKIYGRFLGINDSAHRLIICGNSLRRVISWGDGMSLIKHIHFGPTSDFKSNSLREVPNELPSTITSFELMFHQCTSLNCDLDQWDVSAATNFRGMFEGASVFNGNIGTWELNNVPALNVVDMFSYLPFFDQDLSHWDLSNVSKPTTFAYNSPKFTQNKHPKFKS